MLEKVKTPLHWSVWMNYQVRAVSFLFLFIILAVHFHDRGHGLLPWLALAGQFLLYPHLLLLRARCSSDPRRTERSNLIIDSVLLGAWGAALGFPLWVTFTIYTSSTVHHIIFRRLRGLAVSAGGIGLGIALVWLSAGLHFAPDMGPLPTALNLVGFAIYLFLVAYVAAVRTRGLYAARGQLRVKERELQEANQRLVEKNEVKTRFLAYAGHDLRQPLQALKLFLSSLEGTSLDPEQRHLLHKAQLSSRALADLLESLLNISRLDAGAIAPEPEDLELDVELAHLVHEYDTMASARGLQIRLWLPADAVVVHVDKGLLSSALRNLIENALRYTESGGVLVALRRCRGRPMIQVWDTGIGMSQEQQARMYEEFYQANNPQRDRALGLGLGLSIVHRITALLGASLHCRSRPGRGEVYCQPWTVEFKS